MVIGPLGIVVVLGTRDAWIAALLALWLVAGVVLPMLWARPLAARSSERMTAYIGMGATVLDTLQGMTTLKAFGASSRRREELAASSSRLVDQWVSEMAVALITAAIYALAVVGGLASVVAVAAYRVAGGGLEVGTLFLALLLSGEALRSVGVLAGAFHTSYDATTGARRLTALFDSPAIIAPLQSGDVPATLAPSVQFDGVTFAYPGDRSVVLDGLSLDVAAGERVAVVGPSGAGKSTLVALLARFFDPQHGTVRVGGHDVRTVPLDQLRRMVAVVSQDTYLFGGSARDNIAMARPDASDAEVEAAARAAGAHDFLSGLPDGYHTELGERGTKLSGGQRQRVAIARAVLADRPILVLDEATASVDAATEASIQEALDRLTADRTTLVIAHRLSTVRSADRIVVLDGGRLVENGVHDDLMQLSGRYRALVAAQEVS